VSGETTPTGTERPEGAPGQVGHSLSAGMAIGCDGLSFSYAEGRAALPALTAVALDLHAGGSLALLGPSGAGKSTLLQVVRGLLRADAGLVTLDGLGPAEEGYAATQRQVGLVFQSAELQLFAASAREDVAFGPRRLGWSDDDVNAAVSAALELTGLPEDQYGDRHPYSLSGGEQRRLALAGVLAMRPRLLLLDEPFVSLDPATRRQLVAILTRLKESGTTIVLATHDVDLAWALCEERLVLAGGEVVAHDAWDFDAAGGDLLERHRLREPFLVQLWRRLGNDATQAPRTYADAALRLAEGTA
jgi:energy-coupling factor transporter ATP-binding protein EcfA2